MRQVHDDEFPQPPSDYELPPELVGVREYSRSIETLDGEWLLPEDLADDKPEPRRDARRIVRIEYENLYILGEDNPPELGRIVYGPQS